MMILLEGGRRMLPGDPPVPDMIRGAAVAFMTGPMSLPFSCATPGGAADPCRLGRHVFHRVAPASRCYIAVRVGYVAGITIRGGRLGCRRWWVGASGAPQGTFRLLVKTLRSSCWP